MLLSTPNFEGCLCSKHARQKMVDLAQPIVPVPDGYVVDLENPQRRGEATILWIGIMGTAISTCLLAVRAYTKVVLVKKVSSDDCKFSLYTRYIFTNNCARLFAPCMGRCLGFCCRRKLLADMIWSSVGRSLPCLYSHSSFVSSIHCFLCSMERDC